jgi:hypothetical protein
VRGGGGAACGCDRNWIADRAGTPDDLGAPYKNRQAPMRVRVPPAAPSAENMQRRSDAVNSEAATACKRRQATPIRGCARWRIARCTPVVSGKLPPFHVKRRNGIQEVSGSIPLSSTEVHGIIASFLEAKQEPDAAHRCRSVRCSFQASQGALLSALSDGLGTRVMPRGDREAFMPECCGDQGAGSPSLGRERSVQPSLSVS